MSERLHPDDVEAIAQRVAELVLEGQAPAPAPERLLTAAEVAERLGLTRDAVYARATELGAVRLGDGPRARLRFDPEAVHEALTSRRAGKGSEVHGSPVPAHDRPRPRRRRKGASAQPVPALLPVRGQGGSS